jgi:hypothetical protein
MPQGLAILSILLCTASAALAGELTPQQRKMNDCHAEAGARGLHGDARQKFMSACLSAKTPENKGIVQQDRMKTCHKDANDRSLRGEAHKTFMSACLSNR